MLIIRLLEFNTELGLDEVIGEQDVSQLSINQAREEANKVVEELQKYKKHTVHYVLERDGKILVD